MKCISQNFDIGDLRSGQFCDLFIASQWEKIEKRLFWTKPIPNTLNHWVTGRIHTLNRKIATSESVTPPHDPKVISGHLTRPVAQSGEHPTAEPTGSESPVRAASRARYLFLTGMACDQWQRSQYRPEEDSERGGPCPALKGTLNVRL